MDDFNKENRDNTMNTNNEGNLGSVQTDDINTGEQPEVMSNTSVSQPEEAAQVTVDAMPSAAQDEGPAKSAQAAQSGPQYAPPAGQAGQPASNGGTQQKGQPYYTENIKKTKTKKIGAGHLVLVTVLGSILGAGIMFAAMMFLAPAIQPAINNFLGITASEVAVDNNGIYKKVEITQSTTPVEAISEKVGPSIVGIQVTVKSQGYGFFFDMSQDGVGEGSGIIIRGDGYILTNNHVIESALVNNSNKISEGSKIEVILPSDVNKKYTAKIVGRDSKTDIAVLKIEATNLPVAELGDSDKVKSGELAVAIGNPGGIEYMGSVTAGIISGINRTIQMENGRELKLIQTDAAINPGNSGGALVNSQGQVIGINTVKIAATGYEGLGFAIPINEANEIAKSLIDYKYVKGRPYLGVSIDQTFTAEAAKQYNVPEGLLVYEVLPLSSAYKAGVHAGDIITKFDGKEVKVFSDLEDQKNTHKPGDTVSIEVYRDGKTLTLSAVLDEENNAE
ncbi:MAG: trypsin-like peptidase domain-containing protein [Clostridiaceae bacterium]